MINLRRIAENLTDAENIDLVAYRGGCNCHRSPPCGACSNPLTLDEAIALGFVEVEDQVDSIWVVCPYCLSRTRAESEDTDESERDVKCSECGKTYVRWEEITVDHHTRAKEGSGSSNG